MTTTSPTRPASASSISPTRQAPLEARLAAADAQMTIRLEHAAAAVNVNTAHIPTEPLDWHDVITAPFQPEPGPHLDLYPTPIAALLQRAHHRMTTDGWCKGALRDEDGAHCLYDAIRTEAAGNHRMEAAALNVLMDAIRRDFGAIETIPSFNDACLDGRLPLRLIDSAADLADARGL